MIWINQQYVNAFFVLHIIYTIFWIVQIQKPYYIHTYVPEHGAMDS